jgi:hypothetical protein
MADAERLAVDSAAERCTGSAVEADSAVARCAVEAAVSTAVAGMVAGEGNIPQSV